MKKLLALFRRSNLDSELNEELDAHLEMAVADNQRKGMSTQEARRAALASLGGVAAARETHREARGLPPLETLLQDVKFSLRTLRRDAGMAVFAILISGLGVGACATVFSVVHTLLMRDPLPGMDRLVWMQNNTGPGLSARTTQVGYLQEVQRSAKSFSEAAGFFAFYSLGDLKLTGTGEPERLTGVPVTGNFFRVLGVETQLGRQFTAEEAQVNGPRAVIMGHAFWKTRMNSDPGVIGRTLTLNEQPVTVVGVLPAYFDFAAIFAPGQKIDVFVPFPLAEQTNRFGNTLSLVARLNPGVTAPAAHAEMEVSARRWRDEHKNWNDFVPRVISMRDYISGNIRGAMMLLSGAVGLVMLIVCANLSNLLLARANARQKEIAIRAALGAGRGRLIRQMLVESSLLSGAGALFGLVLAVGATRFLASLDAKVPMLAQVTLDWTAVAFTIAVAALTGIGFGFVPALRGSMMELQSAMKAGDRGSSAGREHARIRGTLVVSEVALACLLLVGTGLLIRSFLRVLDVNLGFQPEHALAVRIDPGRRFPNISERNAYYRTALENVKAQTGIEAAGLTDVLPLGTNRSWGSGNVGKTYERGKYPLAYVRIVSDGYFKSMGIALIAGRDFGPGDTPSSERAIIINETMAKRQWPGENPIGQKVRADGERVVVGIVHDVRHLALEQDGGSEMYIPMWQTTDFPLADLVVRGNLAQRDMEAAIRGQLRAQDPTLPVTVFRTLQGIVDRSVSPRRLIVMLLATFAGFAVILASLGIYGVISYSVTQRKKEMGIRMALGASGGAIRLEVLLQTLRLAAIGLGLGLAASWTLTRMIAGMLFGIEPGDPMTFGGALLMLASVALLAGFVPAQRASQLNPVEALRTE
ncbi:MAG: ABC transporter permease [Acidobacteria bacterium]|nr:ABC transporter permease [Acidobacteriota bacterium]